MSAAQGESSSQLAPFMVLGTATALNQEIRSANKIGERRGRGPYFRFNLPKIASSRPRLHVESAIADAMRGSFGFHRHLSPETFEPMSKFPTAGTASP